MIKVLLIVRGGFDADYICSHLPAGSFDFTVIEETGRTAVKKKLVRMFHRKRNPVMTVLDLAALFVYDKVETALMKKECIVSKMNNYKKWGTVDDVNAPCLKRMVSEIRPDVIIIYGTGIVKQTTMADIPVDLFNIHSSVLPAYRNVHSDFWAYRNKDLKKIGISIIRLSAGIDTGDIAMQMVCDLPGKNRLYAYKAWNLKHIPVLMEAFLRAFSDGSISYIRQDSNSSSRYETPLISDLLSLVFRR